LQIAASAEPALATGAVQPLILTPVCDGQQLPLKLLVLASVVLVEGIVLLAIALLTASVVVHVWLLTSV